MRLIIRVILRPLSRSSTVHTGSSPYFSLYDTVVSASRRARSLHSLSVWRHNTCPFAICPCGRRRGATSLGLGTKLAPLDQCFTYKLARPPDQLLVRTECVSVSVRRHQRWSRDRGCSCMFVGSSILVANGAAVTHRAGRPWKTPRPTTPLPLPHFLKAMATSHHVQLVPLLMLP